MKHLEPLPKHATEMQSKPVPTRRASKLSVFIAGALLVSGLGFGLTALWGPSTTDRLSDAKKSQLVAEFSKLKAVSVEQVASQDLNKALEAMQLAPDQRQKLEAALSVNTPGATGSIVAKSTDTPVLVWISLWDFAAPDGDIIHISSAGYKLDVTLQNNQTRIAVPVDRSNSVTITGVHDGGGGITLGVQSGTNPIALPVLGVGQSFSLPVTY